MTKWQKVKLGDVCECLGKGKHPASFSDIKGTYPFIVSGLSEKKCNGYDNDDECFIIGDGGCANIHYVNGKYAASDHTYIFKSKDDRILTKYIYKYLSGNIRILEDGFKGAGIKNISKSYIMSILIPLPPKNEQKRIAKELDAVSDLLAKQKQLLTEQDTLIKATFYDMFGDTVTNDKGWTIEKLEKLGTCKNGINFNKEEQGIRCYLLNVGDFQNHSVLDKITYFSEVVLKKMPDDDYFLKSGDIVFVRSNGNKNLVGRCVAIYPQDNKVLYSGFCIRFRIKQDDITTKYLLYYFKDDNIRKLLVGRGANIQNLNQKVLHQLNIPVPPLSLQQKFADIVEQIEAQKQKIKSAITKTETLFNALMAKYFDEE